MAGVVDFVSADDIPGVNSWKPYGVAEEIFSSGRSHYAGQSLGLVLATSRQAALEAARLVKVVYGNEAPVVCDMEVGPVGSRLIRLMSDEI